MGHIRLNEDQSPMLVKVAFSHGNPEGISLMPVLKEVAEALIIRPELRKLVTKVETALAAGVVWVTVVIPVEKSAEDVQAELQSISGPSLRCVG